MELVFFYLLGAMALGSAALLVLVFRNPVHAALALIVTLLSLAGLFALLDGHFIAAIQVMVYAGAIMVLFLFVIMLLDLRSEDLGPRKVTAAKGAAVVAVAFVTWQLVRLLLRTDGPVPGFDVTALPKEQLANVGTVETVGRVLFGTFLVPFEVTSVLILAAIVGSVVVAKKRV